MVAIAGALRKTSALLKLAEASPDALAFAAYAPEGPDAERMVAEVGRRYGLKVNPAGRGPACRRLRQRPGDRRPGAAEAGALRRRLAADARRSSIIEAVDAVGAELAEGDFLRLADLALAGELAELADELAPLAAQCEAIPVVRALQRRLLMLAPARARVERGERPDAVMTSLGRSLFWKDKPLVGKLLSLWDSKGLATVSDRAGQLERSLMFSPAPSQESLGEELIAIARAARRR